MIREERLLKVLRAPHVSEKASAAMEKTNTIVLKVAKDATKAEIKAAVQKLFEIKPRNKLELRLWASSGRVMRICRCNRSVQTEFEFRFTYCDPKHLSRTVWTEPCNSSVRFEPYEASSNCLNSLGRNSTFSNRKRKSGLLNICFVDP